jgi:hypothetical protein
MKLAIFAVLLSLSATTFGADTSFSKNFDELYRDYVEVLSDQSARERRIMNGIPAAPHQFPYQVIILIVGKFQTIDGNTH